MGEGVLCTHVTLFSLSDVTVHDCFTEFPEFKIISALCTGTGRAFRKAGPDIEKALDQVLIFIRGTINHSI